MIKIKAKGSFKKTRRFLKKNQYGPPLSCLEKYGKAGVEALKEATPKKTGKTAASWHYEIERNKNRVVLSFHNTNIQNGTVVALVIQYGHATQGGYWIEGRDYINPVIQPIFDKIADEAFKEVTN